ncbi:hypothetical protein ACQUW5_02970 [Legionella sp. CNM-1927-20]|uniref:hypothetical protein n=1 Tax=Legionella sp. CNM-1927-20 TaxID=3422221 RepID=UPI00403B1C50
MENLMSKNRAFLEKLKSKQAIKILIFIFALCFLIVVYVYLKNVFQEKNKSDYIVLLIPNQYEENSLLIKAWKNIAIQQGIHLKILRDDDFLRPSLKPTSFAGIILADEIHKTVPVPLVNHLKKYVKNGGKLMLIYDAGTLTQGNVFFKDKAPFSDLVGVDYALYEKLGRFTIQSSEIGNTKENLLKLGIQPGKFIPFNNLVNGGESQSFQMISNYGYGPLIYSWFSSNKKSNNIQVLLKTPNDNLIAGRRSYGNGEVLFVNLPLTFLWLHRDSMPLNIFLHYFVSEMLHLPILASTPNGVGGMVLNIQLASLADLYSLWLLEKTGLFNQGPYTVSIGIEGYDGTVSKEKRLDPKGNKMLQDWIKFFKSAGYSLGIYGISPEKSDRLETNLIKKTIFRNYITDSQQILSKFYDQNIVEYSHPTGYQPDWVTDILEQLNFKVAYNYGNSGGSPLQELYKTKQNKLWTFPATPLGRYITFSEFFQNKISSTVVTNWLIDTTKFVAQKHVVQFIFFHPSKAKNYLDSISKWLQLTKQLQKNNTFKWYTMKEIATFLEARQNVKWEALRNETFLILEASHPNSLEKQAWFINKDICFKPIITKGVGAIQEDTKRWIVSAGKVTKLGFKCKLIKEN